MLQTLKSVLDNPKERSVVLGIEINQDAQVKTEEDLPAEADIDRNGSNGEELHVSALTYEADSGRNGSNKENDWSNEIESVNSEPVPDSIKTNGRDQEEEAVGEIQMDRDDSEDEGFFEL
jgi:hypothetical protein